jgi:hypothetical protein
LIKIFYAGHAIEVSVSVLTGKKKIIYDGKEVHAKRSAKASIHAFHVKENGEDAIYEIQSGFRWHRLGAWVKVRRNGEKIYDDM